MRTESRVGFIVGLVIFLNVTAYTQSIQECQIVKLPGNIEMSDGLARLLQKIHLRSDAFRAQCEVERDIFETERARQAGRIVGAEATHRIGRALNIR